MDYEYLDDLLNSISKKYEKNPTGWKISRISYGGFGNIFVTNSEDVWQIKLDSIYKPKPIGLGTKIGCYSENENLFSSASGSPHYGLRPIREDLLAKILKINERGENLAPMIAEVLKKEPARKSEIGFAAMCGPIHMMQQGTYISERQKEMDRKLKEDLEKLLHRRGYGSDWI